MSKKWLVLVNLSILLSLLTTVTSPVYAACGTVVVDQDPEEGFVCSISEGSVFCTNPPDLGDLCCSSSSECSLGVTSTPTPSPNLTTVPTPTIFPAPKTQDFNNLNPLYIGGAENIASVAASDQASTLSTPGGIVSRVLDFLFPLAGLILFVMLVWGGFEIMMGSVSKKIDAGKQRVTAAIVGFLLLFASYWIWQILQVVFGIKVL